MFQFTEDCLLGVEKIDKEHEHLFELINSIVDMVNNHYLPDRYSEIKELLQELDDYAELHFEGEEAYMEQIRFADKWDNKYPTISRMWKNNWENISTLFAYPDEIRRVIYTTNAIEEPVKKSL